MQWIILASLGMKRHYESHQREECETCKSYLTQFHRCDTKVAYYICYLYSSRRVSHLYYRSGIRVNWTIYIYISIYVYMDTQTSRCLTGKICKLLKSTSLHWNKKVDMLEWSDNALWSFLTAGVRSPVWVSVATHRWLTTAEGRPYWLVKSAKGNCKMQKGGRRSREG